MRSHLTVVLVALLLASASASATERGASVYPIGVETVLPGLAPPPGKSVFFEFTDFYSANQFLDNNGKSVLPEFKLRVLANAFRLKHSWNASFLGGTLESDIALPLVYEQLHIPSGKFSSFGVGNIALGLLGVGYHKKNLHFFYEADAWLPGFGYSSSNPLNIGQHNFAFGPVAAFTYLPRRAKYDLSSRVQYIFNLQNPSTLYQSGNELTFEYAAMFSPFKKVAFGLNGFCFLQTTDDVLHSLPFNSNGNRGRSFDLGPQLRLPLGSLGGLALKFQHDTLVRNRPRGNALWLQICLPLSRNTEH